VDVVVPVVLIGVPVWFALVAWDWRTERQAADSRVKK
jgi:hypothetical protein